MMRVAVQGAPGCFSHAAALDVFGEVELVPCRDFPTLFEAVERGRADRGAVPVENTLAGAVAQNLDLLVGSPVIAVHETYVRVELCLVVPEGRSLAEVRSAASHPVALEQCRQFFARHPHVRPVAAYDTAGSVRDLLGASRGAAGEDGPADDAAAGASAPSYDAAIGPALAAELYGGAVLRRGIEDHARNFTRFLIVAREGDDANDVRVTRGAPAPVRTVARKTSLAFTLAHRPGSLHAALGAFAEAGVDLTRLESRPIPGRPWEYRFFADVRGGAPGSRARAIEALRAMAPEVRVFGTYVEADVP